MVPLVPGKGFFQSCLPASSKAAGLKIKELFHPAGNFLPASGLSEEAADGLRFVGDNPGGQTLQKYLSISAGEKAGIQDGQDTPVLPGADQSSQSLLEK